MIDQDKVDYLAYKLKLFFHWFDTFFVEDEEIEKLLEITKDRLTEKINHNNSALIVITALGGQYDDETDLAKVKELEAILSIIRERKELKRIATTETNKKDENSKLLKDLFGV